MHEQRQRHFRPPQWHHLHLLTHKNIGENYPPELFCVCICTCALSYMISGLVFSIVRFHNTHSLHNRQEEWSWEEGEHTHLCTSVSNASTDWGNHWGKSSLLTYWCQHLWFEASVMQFSSVSVACGFIFGLVLIDRHEEACSYCSKWCEDAGAD